MLKNIVLSSALLSTSTNGLLINEADYDILEEKDSMPRNMININNISINHKINCPLLGKIAHTILFLSQVKLEEESEGNGIFISDVSDSIATL